MKPLMLTMSAFGPFSQTQHIDFSALGSNPLFLINGPTGSGKTTILDGICFALYGKTTGNEREGSQMRCDMASDELLTEVSFSFLLGDSQYRIRRVPEQERLKKSGDGSTVQKSEAQLYKIANDGTETLLVATKVSEATAEIEQLTGLDADQFRQVMVLPQGKFRELLMADSKAREKIFSQLFQTQIYRKIEERLKESAREISTQVTAMRNRRAGILQSANTENDDSLTAELNAITPQLDEATTQKALASAQQVAASNQLDNAKQIIATYAQLDKFTQDVCALNAKQPQIATAASQLALALKAQRLKPANDALQARIDAEHHAANKLTTCQQDEREAGLAMSAIAKAFDAIKSDEQRLFTLTNQQQNLSQLLPQLEQYEALNAQLTEVSLQLAQAKMQGLAGKSALAKSNEARQQFESQLPLLQQQADSQLELQQQLTDHNTLLERFKLWQQAVQSVEKVNTEMSHAQQQGTVLAKEYERVQQQYKQLQWVWHRGQAALLAQQLTENEPCPVCGSQNHPSPAVSEDEIPTEEMLQAAQHQEAMAQAALSQARADYKGLKGQLATLQQHAHELMASLGDVSASNLDALVAEQARLNQELVNAKQSAAALTQLQKQIKQCLQTEDGLRSQLDQERNHYDALAKQHATLEGQKAQLEAAIPEAQRDLATLNANIAALNQQINDIQRHIASTRLTHHQASQALASATSALNSAQNALQEAKALRDTALATFNAQLADSGFETDAAFQHAILSDAQQAQIQAELQQHETQLAIAQSHVDKLTAELAETPKPDIDALNHALQQSQHVFMQVDTQWQVLHTRQSVLRDTQKHLSDTDAKAKALEEQYAVVGTLSDVANGNTGNKISLQRFVLSVLLDDVLLAASQRLHLMSKGRYRLLRKEDRSKGNKASGLDLEVEDAYTSKVRPVATLSGGESFMAALSMALGLSDVVQAYAGGIKLDTLFIDEGFGSLDQESLELAIRTLMDLQSAGRMIGVISHVSEMKEQLDTRLDLVKTAHGSEIKIVLP